MPEDRKDRREKMAKEAKTNAMRMLDRQKVKYEAFSYECDEFIDGIHSADKIGAPYDQSFKTLVMEGKSGGYFVFVVPIEKEVDRKAAAKAVGEKTVDMIHVKDITKITGYVRGGCSPLGMKKPYPVVFDASAGEFEEIYVSGGRIGLTLKVPLADLLKVTGEKLADMGYGTGLHPNAPYVAVKVPVFSFEKLHGVDTQFGPEMKSTGEVLGLGKNMQEWGVKPEIEAFDPGMIANAAYYLKKGVLKAPLHFQFCMGCANGIAGILGYIGSGLSGLLVGYVADAFGWTRVFETIIVIAVIGMFILISMWSAPRDGYERASKIDYGDIKE